MARHKLTEWTRRIREDFNVYWARPLDKIDLSGPFLVVGSAPGSRLPAGFDRQTWRVGTINGSQGIAENWGIDVPDVTVMMCGHLLGDSPNSPSVRRLVAGRRTRKLMIVGIDVPARDAPRLLAEMHYDCDDFEIIERSQRSKFLRSAMKARYHELIKEEKVSNGIFLAFYALMCGAGPVVITGIAPNSTGHAYNDLGLRRKHVDADARALRLMCKQSPNVFTADEAVAKAFDIPLWTAEEPLFAGNTKDGISCIAP
jgi:hypothetical protein